jgi:hypothetical protein
MLRYITYSITNTALSAVFFRTTGAAAVRTFVLFVFAPNESKQDKQSSAATNTQQQVHEALSNPANPMKANDRQPAIMNVKAVPFATSGTVTNSLSSLMDAINISAKVNPRPAPHA